MSFPDGGRFYLGVILFTAYIYYYRGLALCALGRYDEALSDIDQALLLCTDRSEVSFYERVLRRDDVSFIEEAYASIHEKKENQILSTEEMLKYAELETHVSQGTMTGTVTITSDSTVNLRSEGNADSKILGKGKPGDTFPCMGVADSGWYQILLPDGQTAYISNKMSQYKADSPEADPSQPFEITETQFIFF